MEAFVSCDADHDSPRALSGPNFGVDFFFLFQIYRMRRGQVGPVEVDVRLPRLLDRWEEVLQW